MRKFLWILLVYLPFLAQGQSLFEEENPIATLSISQSDLISIDTRDQIFVSKKNGDILLLDQNGKQLNLFSPPRQGRLQQLEASWTVSIFSFSEDLQEYRILDRFLNPLSEGNFLLNEITLPKAATLGNNNVIWVWDESDLSLKSFNYLQKQIIQSQPLNLVLDPQNLTVKEIREFKNRLYLNIPDSGIFIFDNQANFIQKLPIRVNRQLCFYKERIFWIENDSLKSYSIRTLEEFDLGKLPVAQASTIQIGQEILVIQTPSELQIFKLPQTLKNLK
jgi:hypothetical protein